jgi:hypothetical protein
VIDIFRHKSPYSLQTVHLKARVSFLEQHLARMKIQILLELSRVRPQSAENGSDEPHERSLELENIYVKLLEDLPGADQKQFAIENLKELLDDAAKVRAISWLWKWWAKSF